MKKRSAAEVPERSPERGEMPDVHTDAMPEYAIQTNPSA